MEVLETIPIYGIPNWVGILCLVSLGLALIAIIIHEGAEYVGLIMACISMIGILISGICALAFNKAEFKRNEYIVRITDISVQEFIEKYEVTKHFDYSDVIQVKEIEKE